MSIVALVYPHHLFEEHPALKLTDKFLLIEDPLFFKQYNFHKQKLAFHRTSMSFYKTYLEKRGKKVSYIYANELVDSEDVLMSISSDTTELVSCDFDDDWLRQKLTGKAEELKIKITELNSPNFISPISETLSFFEGTSKFLMANFYQHQRRTSGILMQNGKPVGGKWSFDSENRKKAPKNLSIPKRPSLPKLSMSIIDSVNKEFNLNPGVLTELQFPATFTDCDLFLEDFLINRFKNYGDYQDAIITSETFLFHSTLSASINAGLITPTRVINRTLEFANDHKIPINSVEGFIRQILGWREFMRAIYTKIGRKQRTKNFWQHTRKLPKSFWSGTTGILPIDTVISRVLSNAYCHHIERLMVLGNFMLLCEIDPDDVYRWFMEMFIDAYDWVMVPNIYGMSQYADGGMITTKPYISSSNYIKKMSDFPNADWCEIWDGLFWRFIHKHADFFTSNPRLSVMTMQLKKWRKQNLVNICL